MKHELTDLLFIRAIRRGFLKMLPVLMLGAFALVLRSLPIPAYTDFITNFAGGLLLSLFTLINNATFGILSLCMVLTISYCYSSELGFNSPEVTVLTSMACFALLIGIGGSAFNINSLGVNGMFTAICSALLGTRMYVHIHIRFSKKFLHKRVYVADGADREFDNSIASVFPCFITVACFALVNFLITRLLGVESFHELFVTTMNSLFGLIKTSGLSGFLFVLISSLFWFVGIHGSDVLESVMQTQFTPLTAQNAEILAAGGQPTEVVTKTFIDSFVLMGGCGATFCLLIALLLFSRRKNTARLSRVAALPMLFNINEIMVFGLPIIFNTSFFIPFILAPLFAFVSSYLAMSTGLVPVTITDVEWTTPLLVSGYISTGSLSGALLQLFNLVCGVLIYIPFVRRYDRKKLNASRGYLGELVDMLRHDEQHGRSRDLIYTESEAGDTAKYLASELESALDRGDVKMFWQPQFDENMKIFGAEALMRREIPSLGLIYPPLVVKLAGETGILTRLEQITLEKSLADLGRINATRAEKLHLCVNVTAHSLRDEDYVKFIFSLAEKSADVREGRVCLEMTEQMALSMNDRNLELLGEITAHGYQLAIDDFSMGATSVKYLQSGKFNLVKIDGGLVGGILDNPRNKEIIKAIVEMSGTLGFDVLAEFVENTAQRDALCGIGCRKYQGYLCSPALPVESFVKLPSVCESAPDKQIRPV